MALDEPKEEDTILKIDDIDFLINAAALPYTDDKKLDYVNSAAGQGFIISPLFGQGC